jgi:cytoskeletal protein CcmA (bactofilin family)
MIGSGKKQNRFESTSERAINRVAEGTVMNGTLKCEASVRVDGRFEGDLETTGRLVIGPTGVVGGNIRCKQCEVEGKLDGQVVVEELLAMKSGAQIEGEVKYGQLSVEEGAVVTGTLQLASKVKDMGSTDRRSNSEAKRHTERKVAEAIA